MPSERKSPAGRIESLKASGFIPKKGLGQNFLVDPNLLVKIADAAKIRRGERVVEVGSGPGTLTELLAARSGDVVSIELDGRLMEEQRRNLKGIAGVTFHEGDFLEYDLRRAAGNGKIVVVGNIPYHVTSPVIVRILDSHRFVDRALLLVQKEVAVRLAAPPGGRSCGRLTVAAAYRAEVKRLFDVGRNAFSPKPRVDSSLLRMRMLDPPPFAVKDEALFFRLLEGLFRGRRKMIRTGLRATFGLAPGDIAGVADRSGIALTRRPEELRVSEWCALCDAVGRVL